jgi:hypothetical protein
MKKAVLVFLLIAIGPAAAIAGGPNFIVCKSTYALCTTAPCTPMPGKKNFVSCKCNVMTDYSAGLKDCEGKIGNGWLLRSRYHPIASYALCSNSRPWAWCLDAPCVADKDNPSQAACECSVVANQGDYVIVNADGKYDGNSCTTGVYSSATVVQLDQITEFLKTHNTPLQPVPIEVYPGK